MIIEAKYFPTIMSGAVVRYKTGFNRGKRHSIVSSEDETDWSAEINASRDGVSLQGDWPTYRNPADVEALVEVLRHAAGTYRSIANSHGTHGQHDSAKRRVVDWNHRAGTNIEPETIPEIEA